MPVLQVRVTDDEHTRLKGWAETQGLSVSALVKQKVFNSEGPLQRPAEWAAGAAVPEDQIPEPRRAERLRQRYPRLHVNEPPTTKPPATLSPPPPRTPFVVEFHPVPKPSSKKK